MRGPEISRRRGSGRRQRKADKNPRWVPCGYQAPGPGRDLMHADHAIHDVKYGRLRGRGARKIKDLG
ncbi:hypothetical protein PLANTIT3_61542 [Plantibacter sp. T3]|nr:hypothetical protein PLANTIT3_61542 [Plantibacter sp. T3]